MNDNDSPRVLTETERRVLETARDAGAWMPILDLDRLRCLGPGDIETVPSLVGAGLLAHDPDERTIHITDAGRHALE